MTSPSPHAELDHTGERMVPERSGCATFWEHVYRYQFACRFARGRDVLDVACGEGYGTAALCRSGAASVVGMDVDPASCDHARAKYHLDVRAGDAHAIQLADASVDLVVSFETIEHLHDPVRFLRECRRVLRPAGRLIISTPNKEVYHPEGHNPFHVREMDLPEFQGHLLDLFGRAKIYSQCPTLFTKRVVSTYHLCASRRGRLARAAARLLVPVLTPRFEPTPSRWVRDHVVDIICSRTARGAHLVNPFVVRKALPSAEDRPMYYVAVAQSSPGR